MPTSDLPGWKLIFTDDFKQDVPLGKFPTAVAEKWGAYPWGFRDTKGKHAKTPTKDPAERGGWYAPEKTVSIEDGILKVYLHTEEIEGSQRRLVCALLPKLFGPNTKATQGQVYGRYAIRFRSDPVPGYKTAWLLWPDSETWPRDGELDFPEGNLTENIFGFMHWQDGTKGGDQYWAKTKARYTDWHTAVIEWSPDRCSYYLDGKLIMNASGGKSSWTDRIPNTPMHWVIQTETRLDDVVPKVTDNGYVEIDWVAAWSYVSKEERQSLGEAPQNSRAAISKPVREKASCCIQVVDKESGWPVPMVQLRTVHGVKWWSDNAGVIAVDQPELMDRETFFYVESDGYEYPKDGFGYAGLRLTARSGATLRVEVERTAIAQRVGRLTGGGLFAESQKLGREMDWNESGLLGCDSVLTAKHNGKRFWLWGDSNLYWYPLGIFNCTAATTPLDQVVDWSKPPVHPRFRYFRDPKNDKPRGVVDVPGEGLAWLTGMASLPDKSGTNRLVATYMRVKAPMNVYKFGLCVWNDASENFEHVKDLWEKSKASSTPPLLPKGHPLVHEQNGEQVLLFGDPFPKLQCPPTFEAWQDPKQWRELKPQQYLATSSGPIKPHAGSIAFNKHRNRWIAVFVQHFGKPSFLGEVWYAEAGSPTGPWGPAVKILSHKNYSFYNPKLHPDLTKDDASYVLFEGTYTTLFTANKPEPTPRYDYNQILYRLNLDDSRLESARANDKLKE